MRIVALGTPPHEGDFVVHCLRISTQEDGASAPVLLGDLHPHDVSIKCDHPLQVADVNAHVSKSQYSCHLRLLADLLSCWPAALYSQLQLLPLIVMNAVRRSK